ncbi:MAG: Hpy99I family type II restriction endonuclease [Clostridia bacterium]|nr:Hpy99I family type II restriction endonuclease [Clostridia bacterium]
MKQFVYANQDLKYEGGVIRKFEVGTLEREDVSKYVITFACSNRTFEVDKGWVSFFDPEKTGDQFSKKVCNVCNRLLDVEQFQKNQNGKNNRVVRRPSCKECREIIDGVDMTAADKRRMEQIKPHMEIWTCPICKKTTIPGLTSKVVCDHDHKTGLPRAWICDSCNTGLGRFKDDIELLNSAIEYLEKK